MVEWVSEFDCSVVCCALHSTPLLLIGLATVNRVNLFLTLFPPLTDSTFPPPASALLSTPLADDSFRSCCSRWLIGFSRHCHCYCSPQSHSRSSSWTNPTTIREWTRSVTCNTHTCTIHMHIDTDRDHQDNGVRSDRDRAHHENRPRFHRFKCCHISHSLAWFAFVQLILLWTLLQTPHLR